MSPTMRDLRAVMDAAGAEIDQPADRLDLIRRRVRRGRRRRMAAGGAVAAAVLGVVLLVPSDGSPGPTIRPTPSLTGRPVTGFKQVEQGMRLVTAVKFDALNRPARLTFTPTGPNSLVVYSCDQVGTIYQTGFGAGDCGTSSGLPASEPNGGMDYLDTRAKTPVTLEYFVTAAPFDEALHRDAAARDRFFASAPRTPGGWTVIIYSGSCSSETCRSVHESSAPTRPPNPTAGRPLISTTTGTDSRRTAVRTGGHRTTLHLVCTDGAAWAILWTNGKASRPLPCEAAESRGVFRKAASGTVEIAVFPASATPTGDPRALARLMSEPGPIGRWTLKVYR